MKHEGRTYDNHLKDNENLDIPFYSKLINNYQYSVYNKTGISIDSKRNGSIGFINSYTNNKLNSGFGKKSFRAGEDYYLTNIIYSSDINNKRSYKTGISLICDHINYNFCDSLLINMVPDTFKKQTEIIPGFFAQYTERSIKNLTLTFGCRVDYNNKYGLLLTPRTALKWDINNNLIIRASLGKGYKSSHVIINNIGLLASSRNINLENTESLKIENSWNAGGNILLYIPLWNERLASLSIDYYHTRFNNQMITDIERDRNAVFYYSSSKKSFSNILQADLSFNVIRGVDLFVAFRINNNNIFYEENNNYYEREIPLTSRMKSLLNLSYSTPRKDWIFDFTMQLNGQCRLPALNSYNSEERFSSAYKLLFAQISKNSKRFDFYLGIENILDFKQEFPIVNSESPYSQDFDSSMVWGPVAGRKVYCGIRCKLGELL